MNILLSSALSVVMRVAARVLDFSTNAWNVAKKAVAKAESAYSESPGNGSEKYKLALSILLASGLKISPQWAGILVELAWLLFTAVGWPKQKEAA
jgi:hypothetical protein